MIGQLLLSQSQRKAAKIQICIDYKITFNQSLIVDQHPLPTSEELFVTLTGGEQFSKLDLS